MKGLTWRICVVIGSIVFGIYLLVPSYLKFRYDQQVSKVSKSEDPWYFSILPSEVLKLGLDLKGGLHLVLGIDFVEVNRDALTKLKNQAKEIVEREKIEGVKFDVVGDEFIQITFADEAQWKKVDGLIHQELGQYIDFVSQTKDSARIRISSLWESEVRDRAIQQSLETLRNRIDEFGIAEPIIQKQGDEKILVQFPGIQEPGRLKEIIARTAKLTFQMVRTGPEEPNGPPSEDELRKWVKEAEEKGIKVDPKVPFPQYLRDLNKFLAAKIPNDTELLFQKKTNVNTKDVEYIPYLLSKEALVAGDELEDAFYSFDPQNNQPIVNFQLTPVGATKFEKATGENVHKYMAIVLDSNVHSAPRINERIGGGRAKIDMKGGGTRSQQEVLNDAKDTALVLRSGALPARLEFLEERVIGPSLGIDAIKAGTYSLAAGLMLVFIFMVIYYRVSGLIAMVALVLNGVFTLSIMAAFEATLSLPGLAGLTLTLGMAVDANVLIFEHIREELRLGKSVNMAIIEGYSRAFTAIFDSHVTTIIAGVVLLSFGYGPIRGFAVTMLIGLACSLYTSVFATRVIFDYFIVSKARKTISI